MQNAYLVLSKISVDFPLAKGTFRAIDTIDLGEN